MCSAFRPSLPLAVDPQSTTLAAFYPVLLQLQNLETGDMRMATSSSLDSLLKHSGART